MKKLVPATRSSSNRTQAGSRTENAMSAITAVMNQAQVENGMRAKVMPLVRRSSVVAIKLSDPNSCAMQKVPIEMTQRVCPHPCPGRRLSPPR